MAFKLKRDRRSNKKTMLLKRLKELKAKKSLTSGEKAEMERILIVLKKKRTNKIESKKLNNNKQDETIVLDRKGKIQNGKPSEKAKDIYIGDESLESLTIGHVTSTTGSYRRGRIANNKN